VTRLVNPPALARARGYSHAAVAAGTVIALSGQIGWDAAGRLVSTELAEQFGQALANLCVALRASGGQPTDLVSLRIYVTDKRRYLDAQKRIGELYRAHLGRHFPAMALVQVADLLEEGALVEIEGLAVLASSRTQPLPPPAGSHGSRFGFPGKQPW
jgi:enamine deaminase RidA (YjgF/YER057c/UK114 family)